MQKRPHKGVLVVIEGIDGAGTTTQAKELANKLLETGYYVHSTCQPSTGPVGALLREMLCGKYSPVAPSTLSLLFAADRTDHISREVLPKLEQGHVVISDRWYHSSFAYQGTDSDRHWIQTLNQEAIVPDITLFLRVDPKVAQTRRQHANRDKEIFDAISTQKRVAQGYETTIATLQHKERIEVIDGHDSPSNITNTLFANVASLCKQKELPQKESTRSTASTL